MHDIRLIRENPQAFDQALARRKTAPASAEVLGLDEKRRAAQTELNDLQARRNDVSKRIGLVKKEGGDAQVLMDEVASIKGRMTDLEEENRRLGVELEAVLSRLPNLPSSETPEGTGEEDNVEVRRIGTPPTFSFPPKDHVALGEALGMLDFDSAAQVSGARFSILRGPLARLERALAQFMLDLHTGEFGYEEVNTPALVRDGALFGTGQLPKFESDLFCIHEYPKSAEDLLSKVDRGEAMDLAKSLLKAVMTAENGGTEDLAEALGKLVEKTTRLSTGRRWLIPTAEVTLTNMVAAGGLLEEKDLPIRLTAFTQCFRSEAGAAGKDTRGMIRQHQFEKVELVSVVHPDNSDAELERKTGCAEAVLQRLGLCYRVMALCSGDIRFSARKTYDIEVWLPGQNLYREISSCSNCGDFQARRMDARFRPAGGGKGTLFPHTLNGSGLAVGRCLIAVMENFQNVDGSITVPEVLRPYMGGIDRIAKKG